MARKPREKQFYRKEYKQEFTSQLNKNNIGRSEALFRKTYKFETELKKDLSDFSLDEILEFYNESETNRNDYYALKEYLEYSYSKGVIHENIFANTTEIEFNNFLDNNRLRIPKEQLDEYISQCINEQDKLLLILLFEGVNGIAQSEMRNLKKDDIDWNTNTLHLRCDTKGERDLEVSEECMKLLDKSIKEKTLYFTNGKENRGIPYGDYVETGYVIRSIRRKRGNRPVERSLILQRFAVFKEWFNQPKLNPTIIYQSGLIYHVVQYCKKTGKDISELNHKDDYKEIDKRFALDMKIVGNNTLQYIAVYRYIKDNEIKALYGNYLNNTFVLLSDEHIEKDIIEIKKRESSFQFRKMISNIYGRKCAITGEETKEVLDACHIQDYKSDESNHPQNGILLRTDLHNLFDKGLLMIDDNYKVVISDKINSEYYRQFNGLQIRLPKKKVNHPSIEALRDHNKRFIIVHSRLPVTNER